MRSHPGTGEGELTMAADGGAAIEFANAKCRWSAYFGKVPDWVDEIVCPTDSDVNLLLRQFNAQLASGKFEIIKWRNHSSMLDDNGKEEES